jgi:multiple sugar transport system permease protein
MFTIDKKVVIIGCMKTLKIYMSHIFLGIMALSMLAPFIIMIYLSFSGNSDFFSNNNNSFTLDNYKSIFASLPITKYFFNSLFVATIVTIGQVIFSSMAGYAFARMKFKGSDILFFTILITMMIPPQVNIIPLFFIMRELHLIDTYSALILPGFFGGFGVFMFRQFFLSFPKDLEEAAFIDGCHYFQTFFKIALPLALPTVITLAIFTFISTWNSFMWPLIVTNSENMRTLPLALAVFKGSFREIINWGDLLACSVICTIPTILIFLIGKKYFINDMMQGGIKE